MSTTISIEGEDLQSGDTLVGDSDGLSLVYEVKSSKAVHGLLAVETEHGLLYIDPNEKCTIVSE